MGFLDGTGMEKRRYIRVPSNFPVKYYSTEDPQAAYSPYESMSDNISIGGMMFFAEKMFKVGELLRLDFSLPDELKKINLFVIAKVVWVDEIEKDKLYNTGVEFQNITEEQKREISLFVKNSLSKIKEKRKNFNI